MIIRQSILALVVLCALLAALLAVFDLSYRSSLNRLSDIGNLRLEQASDRLLGQLEPYQQLPNLLAKHPTVTDAKREGTADIGGFLLNTALGTGTEDIYVLDRAGVVVASSNEADTDSYVGADFSSRPDVRAAMNGRLGFHHALETGGPRNFFYSRGIIDQSPPVLGVVVAKVDVAELEFEWSIDDTVTAFFDRDDVVFLSNRPELVLRQFPLTPLVDLPRYPSGALRPFYEVTKSTVGVHEIWSTPMPDPLPADALVLHRYIPQIDMTARIFMSTASAQSAAVQRTALAAALIALVGMALFLVVLNRRRLTDRLAVEARAKAQLEARVAKRTEQLERAQDDLVQAGKLAALGHMSAGISHELNQPLATIQILSENAKKLQSRGRHDETAENLSEISAQTGRISRILKNLRAFARKDDISIEAVDLNAVLSEALRMSDARLATDGVTVLRDTTGMPLAKGGEVRLQQVLMNIINNAADALRNAEIKQLHIGYDTTASAVMLKLRDTGSGLDNPTCVFEPFFTTKEIGASKGLGLGLSISHGIMGSLGGALTAQNHPDGGAEFTMTLEKAEP